MSRSEPYSEETIKKAKELFESGVSYVEVADELDIQRWMTVYDWRVKFKWIRITEFPDTEQIEVWEGIATKALAYLQKGEFRTAAEALKIYERSLQKIQGIKKKKLMVENSATNKVMGKLQIV